MILDYLRADKSPRALRFVTPVLIAFSLVIPAIVLVQWSTGLTKSVAIYSQWNPMAPSTAICFLLIGSTVLLQRQTNTTKPSRTVIITTSSAVITASAFIILHNLVKGVFPDIERVFLPQSFSISGFQVGRMSPVTGMLFILVAVSILISVFQKQQPKRLFQPGDAVTFAVFLISLTIGMGYWYQSPLFYGGGIIPVSSLTSVCFLLLSAAQLFNKPENLFYRFVISPSVTAQICRAIIPITILVLLIGDYVEQTVLNGNTFDMRSLAVDSTLVVIAVLTITVSLISRHIDKEIARKEMAVRTSEENFHRSLDDSPLGIRIVTENGDLLYANQAILDMCGCSSVEELTSMPSAELYTPESYFEHETRKQLRKLGEPVPANYEVGIKRKDGEIRLLSVSRKEVLWNGKVESQAVYQDITEHRQVEEKLRSSERRFRELIENFPLSISITSSSGDMLMVNKSFMKMRGLESEEDLRQYPVSTRYYDVKDRERWLELMKENGKAETEIRLRRKDGTIFWASSISIPFRTDSGEEQIISVTQDITERKQAEEMFRNLAVNSPVGVYVVQEGKFVYTNLQFQKDTGYSGDELSGRESLSLVLPEDREMVRGYAIQMLNKKRINPYEYRLVTKQGNVLWSSETITAIEYLGKRASLGSYQNITERKQSEENLRESEERFRGLAEQSPNMIFINKSGRVVYANLRCQEVVGYSREELYSPNFDFMTLIAPESKELVRTNFKKHMMSEEVPTYDFTLVSKSGKRIDVIHSTKLIEYEKTKAILGIMTDITERKKVEETIKLQAELLDLESDSVDLHDFDGNILFANSAFYNTLGYTKEELTSLTQLDDREAILLMPDRIRELNEKRRTSFKVNHRHKNGTWIPMEVHASLIELGGKQMVVSVAHDISDFQKVQQQLMAQDRLASIGQLVSGVAHEINNPLTSVIGFSDLILKRELPNDIKDDLRVINSEALRTANIVKNLLTFARNQPEFKSMVDINDIITKVLNLRNHEQRVNNISVVTHLAPDLPQVLGNTSQIQQVFFNLIINAEQAMMDTHGKGTLVIITELKGDKVKISFSDDGPGISPENMEKLFTPFFTTKGVGKGTGLGLSICHGIISEHGGRIYAESEENKGATFTIELQTSKHS